MKNKGELIIHIGPPKTATTSLQYFFQELNHPEIVYAGINQPRTNRDFSITKAVYKYSLNKKKGEELVGSIKFLLDSGKSIFMSEEMFLFEGKKNSYKTKMNNLFHLIHQFDPVLIIACRDPKDVIPSYYTQVYNGLKEKDFQTFVNSTKCEIYKYQTLIQTLYQIGFKKINLLDYKALIHGKIYLSDIFSKTTLNHAINLPVRNKTNTKKNLRQTKPASLKKIISNKFNYINRIPLFGIILKNIYKIIPDYKLKPKEIKIDIKESDLKDFIIEYEQIKMT